MIKTLLFMKLRLLLITAVLLGICGTSYGQIAIPSSTAVTQNFDGIGTSATAALPTGIRVNTTANYTTGTTATTVAYGTTGTGVVTGTSGGGTINWANGVTASSTDRALGFLTAGSFTSPKYIIIEIKNTGSTNITDLTIAFDYEKYRSGSRQFDWTFFHGATASLVNTAAAAGNQTYAADANNTVISNPPTSISKTVTLTGLSIAPNGLYYLCWTFTGLAGSTNGQGIGIDNLSLTATFVSAAIPDIALANNGTQVAAANVNQGTANQVLHKFQLGVTTANASLTGMTCTTAGSYAAADITNLKVRYSADAILDGADATLSTFTNPGAAGAKTFPSFTAQAINIGTGYIFITADVAANATPNNTISVNAMATTDLTFASGNKTGTTTAGGAQTFKDVTAPTASTLSPADNATGVAIATNMDVTFNENIVKGTGNILVIKSSDITIFQSIDVTSANVTITGATATINPPSDLVSGTDYYLEIPATAFKDASGNFYAGISGNTAWNFTTGSATITPTATTLSGFNYAFGAGPSANQNFSVSGSNLSANLVVTAPTNYEIATAAGGPYGNSLSYTPASGTVASQTIYVRLITGKAIGSYNESISITSTNAITKTITLTGTVTTNASSDVVYNSGSSTSDNTNILYGNYQGTTLTSTASSGPNASVGVMGLYLRDGGASLVDADALDTELTDITFTVTNAANIKWARLFDGNTPLGVPIAVTGGNTLAFTGLSIIAADGVGAQKAFNLRLTFNTAVTDNDKMVFTVAAVNANIAKSTFAASNGGGAFSDNNTANDINRIEVTATKIVYGTQPVSTSISTNLASFSIKFVDDNSNLDFDTSRSVSLAASNGGVNMTSSASYTLTPTHTGILSFTNVQFTTGPQTNITITATTTGLGTNAVVSDPFSIIDVPINSYRSINNGTWHSTVSSGTTNTWEQQLTYGVWTPISNSIPGNTTNTVYIRNTITLVGTNTAKNIIVENGGVLNTSTVAPSFKNLLIKDGGVFNKNPGNGLFFDGAGVLEVEDGGTFNYSHTNTTSRSTNLWNGTEKFHPNSNFVVKETDTGTGNLVIENASDISLYNGACFGNFIVDMAVSGGKVPLFVSGLNTKLTNGDFILRTGADNGMIFNNGNYTVTIGGDLIVETTYTQPFTITNSASTVNFTVNGSVLHNGTGEFRLANSQTVNNPSVTMYIDGNLTIGSSNFNFDIGSSSTGTNKSTLNLKGDLTTGTGNILTTNTIASKSGVFNFTGTGDGLSAATTQTIDVASTGATRNQYINFNVNIGAYAQLANHDLELGTNSTFTVNGSGSTGGTMDFGFSGTTPLNLTNYSSGSKFTSQQASTLKITSTSGISATAGTVGNVQVTNAPTYNSVATFHYIGKNNQVTGTGLPAASSAKIVIVELLDNAKTLTLTSGVGISNTTTLDALGGKLDIRKGTVIGTTAADFSGTGRLVMSDGEYQISTITAIPASNYLPQLSNYANYSLTGGTVNLSATSMSNGAYQILSGVPTYYNLKFSGSNVLGTNYKGISSATGVANAITISETAIVDVKNFSLGGSPYSPSFTMENSSRYITDGAGTKPDAGGAYTLGINTTIEFANSSGAGIVRLTPDYAHVIVSGSNVSNNSLVTGIKFQPNGYFTVSSTGTFKLLNTAGFSGVPNGAISTVNNPLITLDQPGSIVEYAGANQTITPIYIPDPYCNLTVSGSGTKNIVTNGEIWVVNDLKVNTAAVKIESGATLTVENKVFVDPAATMSFETNDNSQSSSLVQKNDTDTNSGVITYKRRVPIIRSTDYTYWTSPVAGQDLFGFSANTPTNMFYAFDSSISPEDWSQVGASSAMAKGVGYCIYGEQISGTPPGFFNGSFAGKPHNGLISVPITWNGAADGTSNLIGNPYPSAIDANNFLNTNSGVIEGTIYFWTHNTDLQSRDVIIASGATPGSGSMAYTSFDYASYNVLGGTGTAKAYSATYSDGFNKNIPNGKIAAGQAFFATSLLANGSVIFNNSMRLSNTYAVLDNSQFFKTRKPKTKTVTIEKHRIWLDLTNSQGLFKQTLIGYITDATNQYDTRFDGISYDGNEFADFYSISQDKNLVIQGRALPFDENDQVPLGFRTTIEGAFAINIDQADGLLTDQPVYIEDKLTNTTFDLRSGAYNFNSKAGTFNDRFILRYTDKTLGTTDFDSLENQVLVSNKNKQLKVNSITETIDKVVVFDLLGRQLFKKDKVNSTELTITNLISSQQTLLVKVTLQNGNVVTKKVLF
jgi:hypothetical protein